MIRIIPFLLMTFVSLVAFGQKSIDVPESRRDTWFYERLPMELAKYSLEDLTKTEDSLFLRIWFSNQIIEVKTQGKASHASLTSWINAQEPIIRRTEFGKEVSQKLLDSLVANNIVTIPGDPYHGIDGSYVTIEVATPERYRLYSYWSPWSSTSSRNEGAKDVVNMIAHANNLLDLDGHVSTLIESLEPGNYRWKMSGFRVDRFLPDDVHRSSLYKTVARRIKKELKVTPQTSHRDFPLLFINQKPAFLRDLNRYENSDVKKLEIITKENPLKAIYGTSGSNGIVLVETK